MLTEDVLQRPTAKDVLQRVTATLDGLTQPANLDAFLGLYQKCVVRDTPAAGTTDGVKMDATMD